PERVKEEGACGCKRGPEGTAAQRRPERAARVGKSRGPTRASEGRRRLRLQARAGGNRRAAAAQARSEGGEVKGPHPSEVNVSACGCKRGPEGTAAQRRPERAARVGKLRGPTRAK